MGPHHAVAWDEDGVGIFANGPSHSTHGLWLANVPGDIAIRAGVSIRDALQGLPHGALKWCTPSGVQRQFKGMAMAAEIFSELLGGCFQCGVCVVGDPSVGLRHVLLALYKPNACQTLLGGRQQHIAQRRGAVALEQRGN